MAPNHNEKTRLKFWNPKIKVEKSKSKKSESENVKVEKIKVGKEEMFNKMFLMLILQCHTTKAPENFCDLSEGGGVTPIEKWIQMCPPGL